MLVLGAVAFGVSAVLAWPASDAAAGVRLVRVASGLDDALDVVAAPGDPRLYVVRQGGQIQIVKGGRVLPRPFLDVSRLISVGGERGLLGLAFHPDYARNGRFFVDYTNRRGDTRVVEYGSRPIPTGRTRGPSG
jgi:glucose/arabinose dehydrogenase